MTLPLSTTSMTPAITPETFYTSEEVSEFLRLSLRTVQRLLANRALHAYKIHGQYRIKGLDLLNYLDSTRHDNRPVLPETPATYTEYLNIHPLSLRLGKHWLSLVEDNEETSVELTLLARVPELRKRVVKTLGFVLPGLRLEDDLDLAEGTCEIHLQGVSVFKFEISPWTDPQLALDTLFEHLERLVLQHAYEILCRDEVAVMIEKMREHRPVVVEEVMRTEVNPQGLSLGQLTQILRYLLKEQVSIQNLGLILEGLADSLTEADHSLSIPHLGEKIRQYLCRQINAPLANPDGIIDVTTLSPDLETHLENAVTNKAEVTNFAVFDAIRKQLKQKPNAVIICAVAVRRYLFDILHRRYPECTVLSYQEVHEDYRVKQVLVLECALPNEAAGNGEQQAGL